MLISPQVICQWLEKRDFAFVRSACLNHVPIYRVYEHAGDPIGDIWVPATGPQDRYYDFELRREWPDQMTRLIDNIAAVLDMPQVEVYTRLISAATA
jgi:hypothetical protein